MRTGDLSSDNANIAKFEAAFYADLSLLKQLVKSKSDLTIAVPIPKHYYWMWGKTHLNISILDILNWYSFWLYEYYDENKICHNFYNPEGIQVLSDCINPSKIYDETIHCINWVCNKFAIVNYDLKNYSQYRLLRHCLMDDEEWLDDDEIEEALKRGFRQIDLDMINESEKGNGIPVYSLMKKGANYKIDPIDYSDDSSIVEILGSDLSFNGLSLISYLCRRDEFSFADSYNMLACLYQTGVSNYILDIVMMYD